MGIGEVAAGVIVGAALTGPEKAGNEQGGSAAQMRTDRRSERKAEREQRRYHREREEEDQAYLKKHGSVSYGMRGFGRLLLTMGKGGAFVCAFALAAACLRGMLT